MLTETPTNTISQRLGAGILQQSTDGGAILPFPGFLELSEIADTFFTREGEERWFETLPNDSRCHISTYYSYEGCAIMGVADVIEASGSSWSQYFRCEGYADGWPVVSFQCLAPPYPLLGAHMLGGLNLGNPVSIVGTEGLVLMSECDIPLVSFPQLEGAIEQLDLSLLAGRQVTIFPGGQYLRGRAAEKLKRMVLAAGAKSAEVDHTPVETDH